MIRSEGETVPNVRDMDPRVEGKRLYLMRHGETYVARLDTPMANAEADPGLALTPRGRRGVEATAQAMRHAKLEGAAASTYHRSLETARIVAEPHSVLVTPRSELQELRLHPPAGGTLRDVARRYLELARRLDREPAREVRLDCGRSVAEVIDTALEAIGDVLRASGKRTLIVAHGGLNRFLLTHFLGLPPQRFLAVDQDFACVNVVDFVRGGRPWVRAVNVTCDDPFKTEIGAS